MLSSPMGANETNATPQRTYAQPIPYDALGRLRTHGSRVGGVIVWVEGACYPMGANTVDKGDSPTHVRDR